MSEVWENVHRTLHESIGVLRSSAIELRQNLHDYSEHITSDEQDYYTHAAQKLSHYAAVQSMAFFFLNEMQNQGCFDDIHIIQDSSQNSERDLNLVDVNANTIVEPFYFRTTINSFLDKSKIVHNEVVHYQTGETLFPEKLMPVFDTAQHLIDVSYTNADRDCMPYFEHLSVIHATYNIKSNLQNDDNAMARASYEEELDVMRKFFKTNNFAAYRSGIVLKEYPLVEDIATWAEKQYVISPLPKFIYSN